MKVGTDAVMLGAWVKLDKVEQIVDVGTGTGILSLIVAQRKELAQIVALELDSTCAQQAKKNFDASEWSDRLTCLNLDAKDWMGDNEFDLIISNPPYFDAGIRSNDKARKMACHTDELSLNDLFELWMENGSAESIMALVLPYSALTAVQELCNDHDAFIWRQMDVYPKPGTQPNRVLLQLSRTTREPIREQLTIYAANGAYTEAYKQLTIELYLGL